MGVCISKPSADVLSPGSKPSPEGPSAQKYVVQDTIPVVNGHQQPQCPQSQPPVPPEAHHDGDRVNGNVPEQPAGSVEAGTSSPLMVMWKESDVLSPPDEQHRWDHLVGYNILDTEPEEAYDRITELCKNLFKVPISMVTFVDKDRVWLKSVQGLPGLQEVERRSSLCAWTLLSRFPEALVVPDLREDVRFKDIPIVVGWPHVQFYAACPLVTTDNVRLGTLCILDHKPREFSAENTTLLAQLANMVMREVERKRAMNDALCSAAVRQSGDSIARDRQGLMLLDMATTKWAIHLVNDAWHKVTGVSRDLAAGGHFWDLFEPPAPAQVQAYRLAVEQRRNFELRIPCNIGGSHSVQHSTDQQASQAGSTSTTSNYSSSHAGFLSNSHATAPWSGVTPSSNLDSIGGNAERNERKPAIFAGGCNGAVELSRRRSISGMRYVRFQFRSVSSVASHMAPAISIPPALVSRESENNYYWATVDVPSAASQHGGDEGSGFFSHGSGHQGVLDGPGWPGRPPPGDGSSRSTSSEHTGPGSDSSILLPSAMKTTFSLLPEDNPFQDITIGSLLGWGSYGRVHRGYWNGSLVAVKVLEQVAGDFNPRSSLEPLLHHRLSHPNIVAMFDVCTQEVDVCEDGRPLQEVWMVLEYCNRGTLSDAIQRGWLLSVRDGVPLPGQINMLRALTTAREVAGALEYLHSQSVLHGDLNGNNILLAGAPVCPDRQDQRGFTAKVADFGLSRILAADIEQIITQTHGTITHMAPEVITEATHSKAADVYSFGVVLSELFSGIKPYHGMHYAQIVSSITSGKLLQLLPEQMPHLPPELLQLMSSCLAYNPLERPTFCELHVKLQELQQQAVAAVPCLPAGLQVSSAAVSIPPAAVNTPPAAVSAHSPVCGEQCAQQIHAQATAALSSR